MIIIYRNIDKKQENTVKLIKLLYKKVFYIMKTIYIYINKRLLSICKKCTTIFKYGETNIYIDNIKLIGD